MASSTKLGVWRRTGVRVQRTGRRTHRVHPAKSIVMKSWREARAGIFGRGRENLRDTAHRQYRGTYERLAAQAEGGAERHQASARAPPRRCPPSCTHTMRPSDARSAAAPPRAPPYGRPHEPYPSPTPPCAHAPSGRHSQASAEPADGAQLPPPPPPARGATAPSSPPFPSHFTSHCWSIEAQSQSSGDRTGENIERGSFDRTGDSG